MTHIPVFVIVPVIAVLMGAVQYANAQSSDWTLSINLKNVPFGVNNIFVEAKGPFGADVWRWVPNQVNPSISFSLSGSQFPEGYNYQICTGTGILGGVLPSCSTEAHFGGDQAFDVNVG